MYDKKYFLERSVPEPKHALLVWKWTDHFKPKKVLDWGCGPGLFVRQLRYDGVEAYGYDPNIEALNAAPLDVKGYLHACPPKVGKFDLILCIDVLEHLTPEEAHEALNQIHELGDRVIFSICYEGDPNYSLDPTHVTCKPKKWWIDFLEANMFTIEDVPVHWPYHEQFLIGEAVRC